MSDFKKQPWFITVISLAAIGVGAAIGVVGIPQGIKKYFNKTNETPYIEQAWNEQTRSGTQGFGIKKSKKHNRKTKKRR
jgi:hypothetical protein